MKLIKLLKYPMQTIVMLAPLFVIACLVGVVAFVQFPLNIILVVFFVWVIRSDEIPFWYGWRKKDCQKFYKNWNAVCEGKTYTETRYGERWIIIDSEE